MNLNIKHGVTVEIDPERYDELAYYDWEQIPTGHIAAMTADAEGKPLYVFLHKLVYGETKPLTLIRHANRNPLDNRRANLVPEPYNFPKGCQIGRKQTNNTSGVVGVQFQPRYSHTRPWRAAIGLDGKQWHLGAYKTREEAVAVRRGAEHAFFGIQS